MHFIETTRLDAQQARGAAALAVLAFEDFYSLFSSDRSRVLAAVAAQFQDDSELNQLVAATEGGEVVGIASYYAGGEMAARQSAGLRMLLPIAERAADCLQGVRAFAANFAPPGEQGAYVARFAIDPSRVGTGLASLMLARMEAAIMRRGWDRVRLHVRRDNARGLAFYAKAGYKAVDEGGRGYHLLEKRLEPVAP